MKRTNLRRARRNNFIKLFMGILFTGLSLVMITKGLVKEQEIILESSNSKFVERYNVSEELVYYIQEYCNDYNTSIDLVFAIMEEKSGCSYTYSTSYGKGLLEMRPSTVEWVSDYTSTFPGEINTDIKTAAKTAVYLVDYHMGNSDNIEDAIVKIVGNEDPKSLQRVLENINK